MRHHWFIPILCIVPSAALSASVEVAGTSYALDITSCTKGDGYYFVDAKGDGVSLSVVTDKTYTAFDVFYASNGEDLRAGASLDPIPLQDDNFVFADAVPVSNGTTADVRIEVQVCS